MSDGRGQVTAVIVNWRTPGPTIRAARALIDDGVPPARVVLVDNASGDGSAERLAAALPDCRLLALPDNIGFARANNAGALELSADAAYLFVNGDAFVDRPGSVDRLLGALSADATGIAVPRLLNADRSLQPSVVAFLTPVTALVRASGLSRHLPNRWQPALATHWDHRHTRPIQSATGAVLAIRASTWRQLGGFDERRVMYAEDHDLLRRAARRGWRTTFVAEAEFVHLGGASADQRWSAPQRARLIALAEADMLRDHLGPGRRLVTLMIMATGAGGRALVHAARSERAAAALQRGWMRGYLRGSVTARSATGVPGGGYDVRSDSTAAV